MRNRFVLVPASMNQLRSRFGSVPAALNQTRSRFRWVPAVLRQTRSQFRWVVAGLILLMTFPAHGQKADFTGVKIFINPGHGGHDGDDRHMVATDFWESDGNLEKGLFLRDILQARKATVYMSRTTNYTSDGRVLLTVIGEMANTFNADFL